MSLTTQFPWLQRNRQVKVWVISNPGLHTSDTRALNSAGHFTCTRGLTSTGVTVGVTVVMGVTFTRFCASAFSSSCLLDSSLVGKSCTRMYKGSKWDTRSLHSWIVHPMFLQFSPPNFPSQRHNSSGWNQSETLASKINGSRKYPSSTIINHQPSTITWDPPGGLH